MKSSAPGLVLAIFIFFIFAVAVSGCDDYSWLDIFGDVNDTNITTTLVVSVMVTDFDGNPVPNATVFFGTGKVGPEDVPENIARTTAITGPDGKAFNVATYTIDTGDGIWYGAATYASFTDFANSMYSTNNTIFYDTAKDLSKGSRHAIVGDEVTLYRMTDRQFLDAVKDTANQLVFDLLMAVITGEDESKDSRRQEEVSTSPVPTVQPTPTSAPNTGLSSKIGTYGVSSKTVKIGDDVSAYVNIENNGGERVTGVSMVGTVLKYNDKTGSYEPFSIMGMDLSQINQDFPNEDFPAVEIKPGATLKIPYSKNLPDYPVVSEMEMPGKYKLLVKMTVVDASGNKKDIGTAATEFTVVKK